MSRALLAPNYCSCTVNRARNLPDKGKAGGIDAFCTISLGKEKFVTAVVEKTTTPDWHEQCDMPIADADSPIKLTIYHNTKNSLSKGDFIGRALVSLRDLPDYDRVHTNWYKLANKDGKLDKNRGEIEVSLQFYSKNDTTGSVLDLATKKKHVSLKDIKHSLSSKLKLASKDRRHSEAQGGDNKLGDQRRRLGGNDGSSYFDDSPSESASIAGSQLSLSSTSHRNNVDHRKKPTGGFNQTPTNHRKPPTALPDVVDQRGTSPGQRPPKPPTKGLCLLGYENVKSTPVNPKVRQELEYTDREDLLHIIAHQSDIIKKRDTRLKDLEQYTDGLLVKIVEQCPAILQSDTFKFNTNKDF